VAVLLSNIPVILVLLWIGLDILTAVRAPDRTERP
jgi:hypothetical protein